MRIRQPPSRRRHSRANLLSAGNDKNQQNQTNVVSKGYIPLFYSSPVLLWPANQSGATEKRYGMILFLSSYAIDIPNKSRAGAASLDLTIPFIASRAGQGASGTPISPLLSPLRLDGAKAPR